MQTSPGRPSRLLIILAFLTVYIVWGSTYFFIRRALTGFPPFLLGGLRFLTAGLIMVAVSLGLRQRLFSWPAARAAILSGFLILFVGNGTVIWVEQYVPSAWVAIIIAASPLWFVALDRPNWNINFRTPSIVAGLLVGLAGIVLLFFDNLRETWHRKTDPHERIALLLLMISSVGWVAGSLATRYQKVQARPQVNVTWQLLWASAFYFIASLLQGEPSGFRWSGVPAEAWSAIGYLVIFGSVLAYSAYIWIIEVAPPAQVSTYAYVNPVVAVILGVFFGGESVNGWQIAGLAVILSSVMLVNFSRYRKPPKP